MEGAHTKGFRGPTNCGVDSAFEAPDAPSAVPACRARNRPAKHDGNPHGAHPVAICMTRENSRGVTAVGNLKQVVVAKVRRAGATALVEKYRDVTQPVWNRVEMKYDLRSGEVRMKRFVEGEDRWQATLVPDSGTR